MTAALLRTRVELLELPVAVRSASILQYTSSPPPEVAQVLSRYGASPTLYPSRPVEPTLIEAADLVLTMERSHARHVAVLVPAAFGRTFTLKEITRRGYPEPRRVGESMGEWLGRLHAARDHRDLLGASLEDDVCDPIGGPLSAYEDTVEELHELVVALTATAWTPAQRASDRLRLRRGDSDGNPLAGASPSRTTDTGERS